MKRTLVSITILLSLVLSLLGSFGATQANSLNALTAIPMLDSDQDGIPNPVETNGWYNLAGGPYITHPNKADSDHDGLTDSEEKLFNTNPTDAQSPGIAVKYDSAFKTFEYYSASDPAYLAMKQGGNRYLLTEGAVIRRGTSFKIAAVNAQTASLTITGADGMTALTPVRDPARGGWKVTVPPAGTVGTYSATITNGAWSKVLPIYVIFELPTDLSQAQINTYLYDDDPTNKRDEVSVWFRAVDWKYYNSDSETPTDCLPGDPICSDWQYHTITGYAQAFWTEQYTKKVLIDYTIPTINGLTNQYAATEAIGIKADQSVRVNYASVKNSFSSATHIFYDPINHPLDPYSQTGGACETSAGVYTAMLRSVGIASRPFALDYNKTEGHGENGNFGVFEYDTAVMMWVKAPAVASNRWYAERSFNAAEPEYQSTPVWASGTSGIRLLSDVGIYDPANPVNEFKRFQDIYADAIQSANEGWDFQVGSNAGGMVNTEWTGIDVAPEEFTNYVQNRDFKWNSKYPLAILQSPYLDMLNCQLWQGDGWAPSEWMDPPVSLPAGRDAAHTYYLPVGIPTGPTDIENWPYNPQPTSCSVSTSPEDCAAFQASWQATCAALPGQTFASRPAPAAQPATSALNTSIQLGNILSNVGLDKNGDGRFDQLVVNFKVTSSQAGEYQLGGWLRVGDKHIRADASRVSLSAGTQTVQVTFDGQLIGDGGINGPYQVEALWAAPAKQAVSKLALPDEMAAYQTYAYKSQAYLAGAFDVQPASISGNYSYNGTDTNGKGQIDTLTIAVPLSIAIPGAYVVEADLYDGRGAFVGHAQWKGNSPTAALKYALAGTVAPYSLEHLNLLDANGKLLSANYAPVYQIDNLSSTSINLPDAFNVTPVDSNANGRYDQLVVATTIDTTTADSYWMEGLLVDEQNLSAAWGVGTPLALGVGSAKALEMAFDARILFNKAPLVGSEQFTLIGVKVFRGSPGAAILVADIPVSGLTTPGYARSQLEPSTPDTNLFQDDIEATPAKWAVSGTTQWSQATTEWHSYNHTWKADGSNKDGKLSLAAPLNLTDIANPWLTFATVYQVSDGQSLILEASTNGTVWTALKTYTGSTDYWTIEEIDLSAYEDSAALRLRFRAPNNTGSIWYIDDVYVYGVDAITIVSYPNYLPLIGISR